MADNDEVFANRILEISEDIATTYAFLYKWEKDEVKSLAIEAAYVRRQFLDVTLAENKGMVYHILQQAVKTHMRKERVRSLAETDAYFYDPEYVRLFLPYFFAQEDWVKGPLNEDSVAEFQTTEAIDTALDIKGAWSGLKDHQYAVIMARHVTARPTDDGGVDWDLIAEVVGRKNSKSAREAYTEATRELTFAMNVSRTRRTSAHQGPGARQAISNAAAGVAISSGK
ncbi:hypothetical protein [Micromonospora coerulea]|uniref:hypothetical protein n=1 Tax=Micromonospora coerulea TaxID=47856 RepID=UPI001902CF8D|nr:hypothetical protein [Micromonospora veneta]